MSLVDLDTGEIVTPTVSLAVPRPSDTVDTWTLCDHIELNLPLVDDVAEVYDAKAKLSAIDAYLGQKSKDGKARLNATMRRLEVRIGELLGATSQGARNDLGQELSGATESLPLSKDERREFRQMAENKEIVETVVSISTDNEPASRRKVLRAIQEAERKKKKEEALASTDKVDQVRTLAKLGLTIEQIADELGHGTGYIYSLARSGNVNIAGVEKSAAAVQARADKARDLAASGHTSKQIASELGMTYAGLKGMCERLCIEVPADAVVGRQRAFDSRRVVNETVNAINGIGMLFDQIDYSALDPQEVDGWLLVLNDSIRSLTTLRNHLKEISQP